MDPDQGMTTDDVFDGSDQAKLARMEQNCLRLLDAGVTSARDLGSPGTYATTLRDRIASKEVIGPRLLVANGRCTRAVCLSSTTNGFRVPTLPCGKTHTSIPSNQLSAPITVPNGHAHSWGGVAAGTKALRAMVRKRVDEGADM